MTTAIKGCRNDSYKDVKLVNPEHGGKSYNLVARSDLDVYEWIPQHRERAISVTTARGTCIVWDENWYVMGNWGDNSPDIILARVSASPQDYKMTVDEAGGITIEKR
jgi:hypothetical protein